MIIEARPSHHRKMAGGSEETKQPHTHTQKKLFKKMAYVL